MVSDEVLFYAGTAVAVIALILLILTTLLFRYKKRKLNYQFDLEYGQETRLESEKTVQKKR